MSLSVVMSVCRLSSCLHSFALDLGLGATAAVLFARLVRSVPPMLDLLVQVPGLLTKWYPLYMANLRSDFK